MPLDDPRRSGIKSQGQRELRALTPPQVRPTIANGYQP
jgi:hypothetical protein